MQSNRKHNNKRSPSLEGRPAWLPSGAPRDARGEVGLDDSLRGLVDVGELEELGLLLVEEVGELVDPLAVLVLEFGLEVVLIEERDRHSSVISGEVPLVLHCVSEEVHVFRVTYGADVRRFHELLRLVVFHHESLLAHVLH